MFGEQKTRQTENVKRDEYRCSQEAVNFVKHSIYSKHLRNGFPSIYSNPVKQKCLLCCRRKTNPLYGENVSGETTPMQSDVPSTVYKNRTRCNKCICFSFLLVAIISCAALVITLLVATGVVSFQKGKSVGRTLWNQI